MMKDPVNLRNVHEILPSYKFIKFLFFILSPFNGIFVNSFCIQAVKSNIRH